MPVAPAFTLGSEPHLCPQLPQLAGSLATLTQLFPHRSGAGALQLEEQVGVAVVVLHRPVGAAHCWLQRPQVSGREKSASQPSSARVEQ